MLNNYQKNYICFVKIFLKNTLIALCFVVYCFSIFNFTAQPIETQVEDWNQSEIVHFAEITKLLFPQSTNTEGYSISIIYVKQNADFETNKIFDSIQQLCKLTYQHSLDYVKSSVGMTIQFPPVKIIFPFHNFW